MEPETSAFDDDNVEMQEETKGEGEFKFMQNIQVHSGSVRSIATNNKGLLLSGSMDQSCKLFHMDETNGKYEFLQELNHHERYVYSVSCKLDNSGFFT